MKQECFPESHIFDPLRQFNPIETYRTVEGSATEDAYLQIDHFLTKLVPSSVK